MKTEPFLESFRDINHRFIDLVDILSALSGLSSISANTKTEQQLLKNSLKTLAENVDLECCSIFLLNNKELYCAAGLNWHDLTDQDKGEEKDKRTGMTFKVGEGVIGKAVQDNKLIVVNDCSSDKRVIEGIDEKGSKQLLTGSLISVPIHSEGKILGALNVSHPYANHFNETHERLLTLFSNFLGPILDSWNHMHKMNDLVKEKTGQLEKVLEETLELKERYQELSFVDDLTGLHNRRFFFPEAQSILTRAIRYEQSFSVIVMDIDLFKEVNDNHGHMAGDYVLENIARLLEKQIRDADVLCRFGGEEFMLALPNTDANEAKNLAERIQQSIYDEKWHYGDRSMRITMTAGITDVESVKNIINPKKGTDSLFEELIKQADRAMYFGKEHGRDQIRVFHDIACKI